MERVQHPLYKRFPPSESCSCEICSYYCMRPGWPLVQEARMLIEAGFSDRLMVEFSPGYSFGILAPAFKGNEGYYALANHAGNGCTFLVSNGCAIFDRSFRPLECRFCHHDRVGKGSVCHLALAHDWNTSKGRRLVQGWLETHHLLYPR